MGKKLESGKFKVGFIFCNEGCNPKKDRSVIESEQIILYTIGCSSYDEAERAAQELVKKGCTVLDLCGAFGNEGVARINRVVERKIPVGAVRFDFHPVFRNRSGDHMFQKDFWCVGL